MTISRRDFMRTSTLAVAGAYLTACAKKAGPPKAKTLDSIAGTTQPPLTLVLVGTQLLSGRPERFTFALFDPRTNMPVPNASPSLWYGKDKLSAASGPFPGVYHGAGLGDRGIYETTLTFPADGLYLAIAEVTTTASTWPRASASSRLDAPTGCRSSANERRSFRRRPSRTRAV
jgi:hypothetical protein